MDDLERQIPWVSKERNPETLESVLQLLQCRKQIAVRIVGHTDSVGSREADLALSERRASAVRDWLIECGIGIDRLGIAGKGESQPVASNDTEEGRARNGRVEIAVRH